MKRFLSMLIVAGMLCSLSPFFVDAAPEFTVRDDSYIPRDVRYATREEAVAGFVKAAGLATDAADLSVLQQFKDAGAVSAAYAQAMAAAISSGLVTGYTDGNLRPQSNVTRAEALVILRRALAGRSLPAVAQTAFSDVPPWAETEIADLARAGVVKGYGDGRLGAADLLTRDQVDALMERAARMLGPAGDFYEYVNRDWLDKTQLPAGQVFFSNTYALRQKQMKQIGEIVYSLHREHSKEPYPRGSSQQKLADVFYAAGNTMFRDKVGLEPARQYLNMIDQVQSLEACAATMAVLEYNGFHGLLPLNLTADARDASRRILTFSQCYTGTEAGKPLNPEAYRAYLVRLFSLFGTDQANAEAKAANVAALCQSLSETAMPLADHNRVEENYRVCSLEEAKALFSGLNLSVYLEGLGLTGTSQFLLYDLPLAEKVNGLFRAENLELLKDYLRASVMDGCAMYLNSAAFLAWRDYQDALTGTASGLLPGDLAMSIVEEFLGWDLAKLYVENYVRPETKTEAEAMTRQILAAYRTQLERNTWLSPETKAAALRKIDNIRLRVGYPENLDSYLDPQLQIPGADQGGNLIVYRVNCCRRYFDECRAALEPDGLYKADQTPWSLLPQTVNAIYDPGSNSITIPAGILAPPFYDPAADFETNLGGIGTVIAHEAGHALDALGSKFDENGTLRDWWQEQDKAAYAAICQRVTQAYSQIEVLDGKNVDGALTLEENLADLAGMACILELAGADNPRLDQVFRAYAETWRLKAEPAFIQRMLETDTHAPDKVRVNRVLANFSEFQDYYALREGDGMYLPEDQRISIWR